MDALEARLECLKLVSALVPYDGATPADFSVTAATVLDTAKKWAEFVVPAIKESARSGTAKGADEK